MSSGFRYFVATGSGIILPLALFQGDLTAAALAAGAAILVLVG